MHTAASSSSDQPLLEHRYEHADKAACFVDAGLANASSVNFDGSQDPFEHIDDDPGIAHDELPPCSNRGNGALGQSSDSSGSSGICSRGGVA